jgi:hypothetical protein
MDTAAVGIVSWHAMSELDTILKSEARWEAAMSGTPHATEDIGLFFPTNEPDVYIERDRHPQTLEEVWVRVTDGNEGNTYLAARRGPAMLVVAGNHFALAHAPSLDLQCFVAGRVTAHGFCIEMDAGEKRMVHASEGRTLLLPGAPAEWTVLPGSTIPWPVIGAVFAKE